MINLELGWNFSDVPVFCTVQASLFLKRRKFDSRGRATKIRHNFSASNFFFIALLNTVFNKKSIMMFSNAAFNSKTIHEVIAIHPSIERLYQAAKELRDVSGQSAVARLLEKTPQVIKNWEARGISSEGALLAQKVIGCDANWLLEGAMQMRNAGWLLHPDEHRSSQAPHSSVHWSLDQILTGLAIRIAEIDPASRDELAPMLSALVMGPDSREIITKITTYIDKAPLKQRSAHKLGTL